MISVLLVDDDPMVRTGLKMIIAADDELSVVGEAANGEEALAASAELNPDVVLLDIRMPVLDGIGFLDHLNASDQKAPRVLVLTTFNTDDYVLRALSRRAQGFLLKDTDPVAIIAAIKSVHRGEPVLSPCVTSTVIAAATTRALPPPALSAAVHSLTDREREIAVLMAQGLTNTQIAKRMSLSLATVKAHLTKVFNKLDTDNRVSAAIIIRDAGLMD